MATKVTNEEVRGPGRDRSKSGALLGTIPFLRSAAKHDASKQADQIADAEGKRDGAEVEGSKKDPSVTASRARKRKGSLRKAAMAKMREHSGSLLKEPIPFDSHTAPTSNLDTETASIEASPFEPPAHEVASTASSSFTSLSATHQLPSLVHNDILNEPERPTPKLLASPMISSPEGPYVSTTDDDDSTPFYPPSVSSSISSFGLPTQDTTTSLAIQRRGHRSDQQPPPSKAQANADAEMEDDWDYGETEWWGWVILIATWIVFVVVMGSCLGVWSWAWDVGETPYAPPELEDDATLPITGYYPALIVCTAVMSWVWVVVAWVGMKYFRHSKVV